MARFLTTTPISGALLRNGATMVFSINSRRNSLCLAPYMPNGGMQLRSFIVLLQLGSQQVPVLASWAKFTQQHQALVCKPKEGASAKDCLLQWMVADKFFLAIGALRPLQIGVLFKRNTRNNVPSSALYCTPICTLPQGSKSLPLLGHVHLYISSCEPGTHTGWPFNYPIIFFRGRRTVQTCWKQLLH